MRYVRHAQYVGVGLALCAAMFAIGCGGKAAPPVPAPAAPSPEEAMASWRSMMASPAENLENPNLKLLAWNLAQSPEHAKQMVAELEDPNISNERLIALVASLEEVVSPQFVPELVELTTGERPAKVRAAATYLLGLVVDDEATQDALEQLRGNDTGSVRLAALMGLAMRADDSARLELYEIFRDPGSSAMTRERIVMTISAIPREDDRPLFEQAIKEEGFDQETYLNAVSALGRIGTTESLDALESLKSSPACSEGVRQMCDNVIAAIEERSPSEETVTANPS